MSLAKGIIILAALLLASLGFAQPTLAKDELLTPRWRRILDSRTTLTLPTTERPERNGVFVYIYAGANYCELLALTAEPNVAQPLASNFEGAMGSMRTSYSTEDGLGVVSFERSRLRIGAREAQQTLDVPAIFDSVKKLGKKPTVLIRLPTYATIEASGYETESTTTSRYFLTQGLTPISKIHLSAKTTSLGAGIAICALLLPLLGSAIGLLAAISVGKNQKLPLVQRRQRYTKLVMGGVFGTMAVHAPLFLAIAITRAYRPYADVWFGSRSALVFAPAFLVAPLILLAILPFANRTEKKLFGPPPEAPNLPAAPTESADYKRLKKVGVIVQLTLIPAAIVAIYFLSPNRYGSLPFIPIIIGQFLYNSVYLPRIKLKGLAEQPEQFVELQTQCDELSRQFGVPPPSIKLSKSEYTSSLASISASVFGTIKVSARFVQLMTPEEAKFLLANGLAQISQGHPWKRLILLMAPSLAVFTLAILSLTVFHQSPFRLPIIFAPLLLAFPFAAFVIRPTVLNATEHADLLALDKTMDFATARSAILKLNGIAPEREDADSANTFMQRRISSLRSHARSLGLDAP